VVASLSALNVPTPEVGAVSECLELWESLHPSLVIVADFGKEELLQLLERAEAEWLFHSCSVLVVARTHEDAEACLRAGATDYVLSDYLPKELEARVRHQIQLQLSNQTQQLTQRRTELETLLGITQALSTTLDVHAALHEVVVQLAGLTSADRVSVVLFHEQDRGIVLASSDSSSLESFSIDVGRYPELRHALLHRKPTLVADSATAPLFAESERAQIPYASSAVIPIEDRDRCLGVLFLRAIAPRRFRPERAPLLQVVGQAMSSALQHAEQLQLLRDESHKHAEALQHAEQRLRLFQPFADFFRNAADGMVVVEATGRILFANASARLIASEAARLEGANALDFVLESDRPVATAVVREFRRGNLPRQVELRVKTPEGPRTLSIHLSRTPWADPRAPGPRRNTAALLATFRDVTRQRQTEDSLRRTTEFLERVIDSSVDAIVSADTKGQVLVFNRAAARIFGYAKEDVVGQMNVRALYPPGVAVDVMHLIRSSAHGGFGRLEDFSVNMQDSLGRAVPVKISAALVRDGGRILGSVGVFTDVREKLRLEADLVRTQDELRERERDAAVTQLAGAAAHELNQPLTVILSYGALLSRQLNNDPIQARAARVIAEQAERMSQIVRQIGSITRYETKPYVGNTQILDLSRAVENSSNADQTPPLTSNTTVSDAPISK
jgi:PAS domain S-box-containing protein